MISTMTHVFVLYFVYKMVHGSYCFKKGCKWACISKRQVFRSATKAEKTNKPKSIFLIDMRINLIFFLPLMSDKQN